MTADEHQAAVDHYRAIRGRQPTPAEYLAYLRGRSAIGEQLTAGQRAFVAAARRPLQRIEDEADDPGAGQGQQQPAAACGRHHAGEAGSWA